jgi:hypothetical protein
MPKADSTLAFNDAEFQLDPAYERFFSQPYAEHEEPAVLPPNERRAMRATFAMLGVFAVALTLFLVYARVIMPVPAQLDADRMQVELP